MPPFHISSTSRALYRVFIAPTLNSPLFRNPQHATSLLPRSRLPLLPQTTLRTKMYKKVERHALSDAYTFDKAITSPYINFVDLDGTFHPKVSLFDAFKNVNRTTHHLLQLSPGKVDAYGQPDPENLPVCKVIAKMELRAQHQRKLDIERRKSRGLGSGPASKNLELNWAIAGGDLKHRLEKMKGFLREGRKVEVLLGQKKRGKVASSEECSAVLNKVREAVGECKGAGEVKEPEGVVGGVLMLVFEGRKIEEMKENKGEKRVKEKAEKNIEEKEVEKVQEAATI